MMRTDSTFPCVMSKAADLRAGIQCFNGVTTQRTKTHRRNIEHACAIRLFAPALAKRHAGARINFMMIEWSDGMCHPLIALGINIQLRSKRDGVNLFFSTL